jgi:hypothetical protein
LKEGSVFIHLEILEGGTLEAISFARIFI